MPLNTLTAIKNGLRTPVATYKASVAGGAAGRLVSLWTAAGLPGVGATAPNRTAGSGYQCTASTAGALPIVYPTGRELYLTGVRTSLGGQAATVGGTLKIYDRLWHCANFSGTDTLLQSVTTPGTIPARDRNGATAGAGVEMFLEIYSAIGATPATVTVNYTDQTGSAGVGTVNGFASANFAANNLVPVELAAGDNGVQSVASLQLSGSTGTAGNFGVTLMRLITEIDITGLGEPEYHDVLKLGKPRLYSTPCLQFVAIAAGANTQPVQATLYTSQD